MMWENANPTQLYNAKRIAMDLSKYSEVVIVFNRQIDSESKICLHYIMQNISQNKSITQTAVDTGSNAIAHRSVLVTKDYIDIHDCNKVVTYAGNAVKNNEYIIPKEIFAR